MAELQIKEVQDAIGVLIALRCLENVGDGSRGIALSHFLFEGIKSLHGWHSCYIQRFIIVLVTTPSCTLMTPIPRPPWLVNTLFLTYFVSTVVVCFRILGR